MAKIKRGGTGVRRAAKAQTRSANARKAKAKTTGFFGSIMDALPFTEAQWQKGFLVLIFGAVFALGVVIANAAGVPALARAEIAKFASDAGLEVRHVRVSGTDRMDEQQVYARALAQRDQPVSEVDLSALRDDIMQLPWVKDARVSLQLPQTLVIDVIERRPHAVLQKPDRMMLIDASGHELEPISREDASDMLRILGPGAAKQVARLDRLLNTAPALRPQIDAVEWVGNRRWNLTFKTGQILALPEGEDASVTALVKFAQLDGQNRLIGGEVTTFDMRAPPRLYMRQPGRGDEMLELEAAAANEGDGDGG